MGEFVLTEPVKIKAAFQSHFQQRLLESNKDRVFELGDTISSKLSREQSLLLESNFSIEEVKMALDMTEKTKAPVLTE